MSTSISAYGCVAHNRKSSRKSIANHVLGGASVACLLLGCAWTVYANIFAASVYPQLGSTGFDVPVTRQPATARSAAASANTIVAARWEFVPATPAPAAVPSGPSLSFEDRFASAAPQGQPSQQVDTPKLAEASPRVEMPKLAEALPRAETSKKAAPQPKLAEAPKPKDNPPPAPVQVASIAPPPRTEAKKAPANPSAIWRSAPRTP